VTVNVNKKMTSFRVQASWEKYATLKQASSTYVPPDQKVTKVVTMVNSRSSPVVEHSNNNPMILGSNPTTDTTHGNNRYLL